MALREELAGFAGGHWVDDINVRDFIQRNYTEYTGDDSFLAGPTDATDTLWDKVQELQAEERAHNGVLECETEVVSGLTAYGPGYIGEDTKELEKVVGLQTDKPLKRAFMPYTPTSSPACPTPTAAAASSATTAALPSTASTASSPARRRIWPTAVTAP